MGDGFYRSKDPSNSIEGSLMILRIDMSKIHVQITYSQMKLAIGLRSGRTHASTEQSSLSA